VLRIVLASTTLVQAEEALAPLLDWDEKQQVVLESCAEQALLISSKGAGVAGSPPSMHVQGAAGHEEAVVAAAGKYAEKGKDQDTQGGGASAEMNPTPQKPAPGAAVTRVFEVLARQHLPHDEQVAERQNPSTTTSKIPQRKQVEKALSNSFAARRARSSPRGALHQHSTMLSVKHVAACQHAIAACAPPQSLECRVRVGMSASVASTRRVLNPLNRVARVFDSRCCSLASLECLKAHPVQAKS
jgi:hypothetical protein